MTVSARTASARTTCSSSRLADAHAVGDGRLAGQVRQERASAASGRRPSSDQLELTRKLTGPGLRSLLPAEQMMAVEIDAFGPSLDHVRNEARAALAALVPVLDAARHDAQRDRPR